jgi:DNA-binding NtrC family response regulator
LKPTAKKERSDMKNETQRHEKPEGPTLLVVASDSPSSSVIAAALKSLGYSFFSVDSEIDPVDLPSTRDIRIILLADKVSSEQDDHYQTDLRWALYFRNKTPDCYLLLAIDSQTDSGLCAEAIESGINGFINIDSPDFLTLLADRIEETLLRFSSAASDTAWITNVMGIPACSKPMQDLAFRACQVASLDHPILIEADHAEGPFQLAHAIHKMDPRRFSCPFYAIGSESSEEILSDHFSEYKNIDSFTTVVNDCVQRMIYSGGGTLVFEDISHLTSPIQEKVYRVLQKRNCLPNCNHSSCSQKIRIISLTSQPILPKVLEGHFHKDLYRYLSRVQLRIPPLYERKEDIPLLINYFIQKYAKVYDRAITAITPEVYPVLQTLAEREGFTGLENIIRTSLILKSNNSIFSATDLPDQANLE